MKETAACMQDRILSSLPNRQLYSGKKLYDRIRNRLLEHIKYIDHQNEQGCTYSDNTNCIQTPLCLILYSSFIMYLRISIS